MRVLNSAFDHPLETEENAALSEEKIEVPSPPVSCAAILAKKMGASEMQTVMAAGLAGSIGLSGGACGVLGTAIWIIGINSLKEEGEKLDYKSPRDEEEIDIFFIDLPDSLKRKGICPRFPEQWHHDFGNGFSLCKKPSIKRSASPQSS